ncbi:MAG: adenylate/guanylate cyclase domain-containing protein [Nitriliruptoraceae bacterium]
MTDDAATPGLGAYVPHVLADWLQDDTPTSWKEVDATLVFVDVSGFTNLSERLARAGHIGAEELADTISACFTDLLDVASADGGSLLKFGGDALLLLFSGPAHTARGARAAAGMRRSLRSLGKLETSAGPVTLRMSIGLHSGPVHLFLVGDSHRELVVCGPGATETVAMESAAKAGQIVVSPSAAERLDPSVVGEAWGPGFLLEAAADILVRGTAQRSDADPDTLLAAIPVGLRDHLRSGQRNAEHRRVTVAFLEFTGIDGRVRDEGPAATATALESMIAIAQRAAAEHDITFLGTDVDAGGGKVLLTSGAPFSRGNDEERMLLALRSIVEQASPLPLQIGVHSGHVFAGDIGPPFRRSYTVMGDAVNLAARVMSRSSPGEILATDDVLDASRTLFDTSPLEPFHVKGKSEPVIASVVGPVAGSRVRTPTAEEAELPFVGREQELATFDSVLAATAEGAGHLLEVVGDAGIGKSRLLAVFRDRTTDRPVHQLVCELHRATTAYASMRKLLRELFGTPPDASGQRAADDLLALVRERLPHRLDLAPLLAIAYGTELPDTPATANLDEQFLRPRLHELVLELLATRWDGPVLLLVEDAQWMDEASADVLRAIGAQLAEHPWAICVTRRDQDPAFTEGIPSTTITLQPLDTGATESLASAATDASPLAPHEMAQLVERSAGNPLFLQELVVAAREAGGVESLPGSIESLMTARIDRLAPELREVLREVSVLGYSFPRDLAAAVVTSSGTDRLQQLSDFLSQEDGLVRFRHAMIRDAAYGGLAYRRRRALHATAGDTIAASGDDRVELLSFHYHLAERHEDAWEASITAGERAAAVYANAEAARFYGRALDAARRVEDLDPVEVARVSETLGDALQRMGEIEKAGEAYSAASRELADDTVAWSGVLLKSAQIKAQLKRYSQALASITRGLKRLEGLEDPVARSRRAQLMVWYGHLRLEQGRSKDAIAWCEDAIEEAEAVGDRDALAHAYRLLDWAYVDQGRPDLAVYSPRAIELYEELGDLPNQASVLNNLGGIAYWAGNWTEALAYYQRANELNEQVGDVIRASLGRNNIAEILADQGRWDEADELFREVERALRAANFGVAIAYVRANLGRTAARAGRFDEAAELLEEARRGAYEAGAGTQVVEAEARLAELHVLRGQPDEALQALENAVRRSDAKEGVAAQEPLLHRVRGYALLQRGEVEAARSALEQSLEAARTRDADYERALAERALIELAEVAGVEPGPELVAANAETLDALGVVRLPAVPLGVPSV